MLLRLTFPTLVALLLASCTRDDRPLVTADDLLRRGINLYEEEAYQQAEVQFAQAIAIYSQHDQPARLAEVQGYLARVYLAESQFGLALESVDVALEHCRRDNYFRGEAEYSLLRGDVLSELGDHDRALEPYRSSRALSAAFDDKRAVARVDLRLGRSLLALGQYSGALESFESALVHFRAEDDDAGMSEALTGLGEVYAAQRRSGEALNSLVQALDLVDRAEQPAVDARIHLAAGNVHRLLGDRNAALRYYRDGANRLRARQAGKRYEILLMFRIGALYLESARYEDARSFFTNAAARAKEAGDRLAEYYLYYFVLQTTENLIPQHQRAVQRERMAQSYIQLAERFKEIEHKSGEACARHRAGTLLEQSGRWAEAIVQYQLALHAEEGRFGEFVSPEFHVPFLQELGMEERRQLWYASIVGGLVDRRRPEEAFLFLERANHWRQFQELSGLEVDMRFAPLAGAAKDLRSSLQDAKLVQTELSALLSSQISRNSPAQSGALRRTLTALVQEISAGARDIYRRHANYAPLIPASPQSVQEIQAAVPRGSLVIQHLPIGDRLLIFALSRTSFQVKVVSIKKSELQAKVTEYLALLHDPSVITGVGGEASVTSMTRFALLSSELYELLIRPVDPLMDRSLVIVPSGMLENFPFHALERQEPRGSVRYLIELTNVDYLSSFQALRFRTAGVSRIRDLVAVGDPGGKNWSVDYELRDLRSFFRDIYLLLGAEATWDRVRNLRGDVLQLATNFTVGPGTTPLGTVTFADPTTLENTVEIPFQSLSGLSAFPIVVLSNHLGGGSGLSPLHALLMRVNGASDVFYNGWGADRKASKFFSEFFFTHLADGLAPGDAFRQALLNMIQRGDISHPHQWAQFFHFGLG